MQSLPMDRSFRRARGVVTSILLGLGLLFMALAANAMVTSHALAAPERVSLSGSDVAIFNLAGVARLEAGTGSSVTVDLTYGGRDAGQLKTRTSTIRGRNTLVVDYPSDRVVYPEMGRGSNTTLRVREDGTFDSNNRGDWMSMNDRVRISGSGSGLEAHADLAVRVPKGQKIALYLAAGDVTVTNVDGTLRVDTGSGEVNTTNTRGELVVDTGSGDVNVGGATGPVDVDTGSGDVNVAQVKGDELKVDTGSGAIRGREIAVSRLLLDTGSGEVEISGIDARDINVDTGSGSVELALLRSCDDLAVDTGSGDVTVRVPRDYSADISFESGSGDFDSDLPVTLKHRDHGSFRGRIGSGTTGRMVVETGSGDLRLASNSSR